MNYYREACREYALNVGRDNPDQAWIVTPLDTYERNPFYRGAPQPHPETVIDLED